LVGPLIVVAIFEERPPYDCLSRLLPGDEVWVAITVDNPYAAPRFACRRERMKLDLRARAGCYATHSDAKEVARGSDGKGYLLGPRDDALALRDQRQVRSKSSEVRGACIRRRRVCMDPCDPRDG